MTIFQDNAKKYWDVGLPVIPLIEKEKRPAILRWQLFADKKPEEAEKSVWLSTYPNGNIGLPMGPSAGLVAIDIDTDDPKVLRVLEQVLPETPWIRIGKKGMVKIYRYTGERTTRIKGVGGDMICEILSKGTQIVLPPSIHPDTKREYTSNSNLYEVFKSAPPLPMGIEDIIRGALSDIGVEVSVGGGLTKTTVFIPAGARDNTMTSMAGLFARAVIRGERSLLQVMGEMEAWVNGFVEKVIGDPLSIEKAQSKIIEFLVRDVTSEKRAALPVGWDEGLSLEDKTRLGLSFTHEDEKWTADAIIGYIVTEFERWGEPNSEGRMNAINVALAKLARADGTINIMNEERVLKLIQSQSQSQLSIGVLKKQLSLLRRGDIEGNNHQEIAEAVMNAISKFGELRYDAGKFWQWKGAFWAEVEDSFLQKTISKDFGAYPACRRHSDYQGVQKVMKSIAAKPLRQVNVRGLNFANGFLTDSFDLIEHNPDHGMIYILPYRYMPEIAGHMPIFNQYLDDSWAEDPDYMDKVAALQEAMGVTLFGHAPTYQRAFCLFGQPGSGKSVLSTLVRGLLPDGSYSSIPPSDWGDRFLPVEMFGKVLNFAGELSEDKRIPGDIFKQIIEGELITGQHKNEQPFMFRPIAAQWFNSNHLPKTRDSSDGFNRRWLIFEWNKRVDVSKRITDLAQIILEHEKEAIVAWAVEGFKRLRKNRDYTLPTSHMACIDQMATDNNSVRYFLAQSPRLIIGQQRMEGLSETSITAVTLHGEYWSFCIGIGAAQRVGLQTFQKMMKELQPVYGFLEVSRLNSQDQQEIMYEWITVVDVRRKRNG